MAGFEPTASWTRTKRDTKLRHTPNLLIYYTDKAGKSQVLFHRVREFHPSPRSGISSFSAFGNHVAHGIVLTLPRSGIMSHRPRGNIYGASLGRSWAPTSGQRRASNPAHFCCGQEWRALRDEKDRTGDDPVLLGMINDSWQASCRPARRRTDRRGSWRR